LECFVEERFYYDDFEYILSKHPRINKGFLELAHLLKISPLYNNPGLLGEEVHNALLDKNEYDLAVKICKKAPIFMRHFKVI
jgi:hypothetical protein